MTIWCLFQRIILYKNVWLEYTWIRSLFINLLKNSWRCNILIHCHEILQKIKYAGFKSFSSHLYLTTLIPSSVGENVVTKVPLELTSLSSRLLSSSLIVAVTYSCAKSRFPPIYRRVKDYLAHFLWKWLHIIKLLSNGEWHHHHPMRNLVTDGPIVAIIWNVNLWRQV